MINIIPRSIFVKLLVKYDHNATYVFTHSNYGNIPTTRSLSLVTCILTF